VQTIGFSKKVAAAVITACGAQLIALVVQVVATGEFDRVAAAQLVGVALTAVLGTYAGYQAPPNDVQVDAIPGGSVPPPQP
jgi:hypothetical protein